MSEAKQPVGSAYAIFIQTICEGLVPLWYGQNNYPIVYSTELEAQREIEDDLMERLQQFMDGEREYDDAITVEEFILPVDIWPDGSISTEDDHTFGKRS